MVKEIRIDRIKPHPKNPRKDLGDLAELADSIRANGIMQNLVIVPDDLAGWQSHVSTEKAYAKYSGGFVAVLGHRRHAAAKLAGLDTAPCSVSEMGEAEQVAAMLLENTQRSDLALEEQALCVQLLLDLGETVGTVAKKTGLSKKTVKRRADMVANIGIEGLEKAIGRQATLEDYEKLYAIKDPAVRAKLLDDIGTGNYNWRVSCAVDAQAEAERKKQIIGILGGFAENRSRKFYDGCQGQRKSIFVFNHFYEYDVDRARELAKSPPEGCLYTEASGCIYVYTLGGAAEGGEKENEGEARRKAAAEELRRLFGLAFGLRAGFVRGLMADGGRLDEKLPVIAAMSVKAMSCYGAIAKQVEETAQRVLGLDEPFRDAWKSSGEGETYEGYMEGELFEAQGGSNPAAVTGLLLAAAYARLDSQYKNCVSHKGFYTENKNLAGIYGWLEALGYEPSEEERQLLDGTHPLYGGDGNDADGGEDEDDDREYNDISDYEE